MHHFYVFCICFATFVLFVFFNFLYYKLLDDSWLLKMIGAERGPLILLTIWPSIFSTVIALMFLALVCQFLVIIQQGILRAWGSVYRRRFALLYSMPWKHRIRVPPETLWEVAAFLPRWSRLRFTNRLFAQRILDISDLLEEAQHQQPSCSATASQQQQGPLIGGKERRRGDHYCRYKGTPIGYPIPRSASFYTKY